MSNDVVIRAEALSKRYTLGEWDPHRSLRESFRRWIASPVRRAFFPTGSAWPPPATKSSRGEDHIWALRDVSFEVKRGEILGIIGRNGAGKSTLLRILTRITKPTSGKASIRGRVGSLLEVGTGFHPDLTGRENVHLNGAILGMTRAEIKRKFDDVVEFSGVERFLDTPIKRYSSGMRVRLAFAVAAHLDPEILLVDEVLAVGDVAFQDKCVGKMDEVAKGGRTVLFISHNMNAVHRLCTRAIQLDQGQIQREGDVNDVVSQYLESGLSEHPAIAEFPDDPSKPSQYVSAAICRSDGEVAAELTCDDPVVVDLTYAVRRRVPGLYLAFHLRNHEGIVVLSSDIRDVRPEWCDRLREGVHRFQIQLPPRLLAPGRYFLHLGSATPAAGILEHWEGCCSLTLRDLTGHRATRGGVIGLQLDWNYGRLDTLSTKDDSNVRTSGSDRGPR